MGNDMTVEDRAEVINTFISIGETFLKASKHFHLEPILARDTIQAIKELEKENNQLKGILICEQEHTQILEKENAELERKLNDSNELCNQQALRITELEENMPKKK